MMKKNALCEIGRIASPIYEQLSAVRVKQPIDSKSVNRWNEILSPKEVIEFPAGCGDMNYFRGQGMEWER